NLTLENARRPAHPRRRRILGLSFFSPVTNDTKAIVFNAIPLFALSVAYAAVAAALLPILWRERHRASALDLTLGTIFPAVAGISALYGVIVLDERRPLQGHLWLSFAALLVAL